MANWTAMLIEWWEHLRGYDRWTPAVATVQTTTLSRVGEIKSKPPQALGWESICRIRWRDQNQTEHTAVFQAFEESPLYQLCEGDMLDIRFNPASPSEYYLPGLIQSTLTRTWKLTVYTLMFIVLGVLFIIFLFAH